MTPGAGTFAAALLVLLVPSAAAMGQGQSPSPAPSQGETHQHAAPPEAQPQTHDAHTTGEGGLPPFIPPLTDADRRAAFPDVEGHAAHDRTVHAFVLFDRIELQAHEEGARGLIDSQGWIGRDRDRLWFHAEGGGDDDGVHEAHAYLLYGRQIARWWDVVAGVRQDFTGTRRTWASAGIQGLAPYWFDVEATFSVGAGGRTHLRADVQYELLLTNRLILQPTLEAEVYGKSDPEDQIGAGLSRTDVGLRVRYELRRELAPYAGVVWNRAWGRTADLSRAAGAPDAWTSVVAGLRIWF